MKLKDLLKTIRPLAPLGLAEPWDKVGLHVGDQNQRVKRGMLCIDLTEAVVDEAVRLKAQLIIAYHPPIFEPVERLTSETWKGRVLREVIRKNVAVYSPHTALDEVDDGVNDWLASGVGNGEVWAMNLRKPSPDAISYDPVKIVTFVPPDAVDRVRDAMSKQGAGTIGDYDNCSFTSLGEGTFRGGADTNPTIGKPGRFERTSEVRLEMICWPVHVTPTLEALRNAHPYEEPAIDVFETWDVAKFLDGKQAGQGRRIRLRKPVAMATLVSRLKRHLGVSRLEVAAASDQPIREVGVCAGAGASVMKAHLGPLDSFITGEMRHHDQLDAVQRGTSIILAGHTNTERPYLPIYRDRLDEQTGGKVEWLVSEADRAPMKLV